MTELTRKQEQLIVDYMARDYESLLRSMYRQIPMKLPEWTDYESEADFGNVLLQLIAHTADVVGYYQDRVANECFLTTAQERTSVIQHLRLIGYYLSTASPAASELTLSVPGTVNDSIEIARGAAFATKGSKTNPSIRFEYAAEQPLIIDWSTETPDAVTGRKRQAIPVEEGRLITAEMLGTSDGTPNQAFTLAHPSLILRSRGGRQLNRDIILVSDPGGTPQEWSLVETLAFSIDDTGATAADYIIDLDDQDRATIRFGDGELGAIPAAATELMVTYRVGGGALGNVPANAITTIVNAPQLTLLSARIEGSSAAANGADRESIDHAIAHAPQVFRSMKRAVTASDFEALALDFGGVGKVRAVAANWNVVQLFIAPEGGGQVSDALRADLLTYFEDKRPLSTRIEIMDVDWIDVFITVELGIERYYLETEIEAAVRARAGRLLDFNAVDFAQTLYLSKVYEEVESIDGIRFANVSEFRRVRPRRPEEQDAIATDGRLTMSPAELARRPIDNTSYLDGVQVVFVEVE